MKKNIFACRIIGLLVIVSCLQTYCYAQNPTEKRMRIISELVCESENPEIDIIPLKIKFSNSTDVWVGYKSVLELYEYCKKKNGWDTVSFCEKMKPILFNDKIFETIDDGFFPKEELIPLSECGCLYNESADKLKQRVVDKNFYGYRDNRFSCFVYKCFRNNILLAFIEEKWVYRNF